MDFDDFSVNKNTITFGDKSSDAVSEHPFARSNEPVNLGQTVNIRIGQTVICTFGDGPDHDGRFRDIRFNLSSVGRVNEDLQIILKSRGASLPWAFGGSRRITIASPGVFTGQLGDGFKPSNTLIGSFGGLKVPCSELINFGRTTPVDLSVYQSNPAPSSRS
jgi:hypothetical protein